MAYWPWAYWQAFHGAAWLTCTAQQYTKGIELINAQGKLGRVAEGHIVYYSINISNFSEITIRCSPVRNASSDPDLIVARGQRPTIDVYDKFSDEKGSDTLQFIGEGGLWYIGVLGYTSANFLLLATWTTATDPLGCDGVPASRLAYDDCGICGGDGASCAVDTRLSNGVTVLHTIALETQWLWSFFTADVGAASVPTRINVRALSVLSDPDLCCAHRLNRTCLFLRICAFCRYVSLFTCADMCRWASGQPIGCTAGRV